MLNIEEQKTGVDDLLKQVHQSVNQDTDVLLAVFIKDLGNGRHATQVAVNGHARNIVKALYELVSHDEDMLLMTMKVVGQVIADRVKVDNDDKPTEDTEPS
jgi:hypothetical protein